MLKYINLLCLTARAERRGAKKGAFRSTHDGSTCRAQNICYRRGARKKQCKLHTQVLLLLVSSLLLILCPKQKKYLKIYLFSMVTWLKIKITNNKKNL